MVASHSVLHLIYSQSLNRGELWNWKPHKRAGSWLKHQVMCDKANPKHVRMCRISGDENSAFKVDLQRSNVTIWENLQQDSSSFSTEYHRKSNVSKRKQKQRKACIITCKCIVRNWREQYLQCTKKYTGAIWWCYHGTPNREYHEH